MPLLKVTLIFRNLQNKTGVKRQESIIWQTSDIPMLLTLSFTIGNPDSFINFGHGNTQTRTRHTLHCLGINAHSDHPVFIGLVIGELESGKGLFKPGTHRELLKGPTTGPVRRRPTPSRRTRTLSRVSRRTPDTGTMNRAPRRGT